MSMALNYERIMAHSPPDIAVDYGPRECMLYALGIGLGMDPMDQRQLQFVYERANLMAFPTLPTVLGWPGRLKGAEFGIDERLVVAASHKVVLHEPLATEGKLVSRPRIKEVIDKGPGNAAIIQAIRELRAPDGRLVATVENGMLAREHGGFGGKVTEAPAPHPLPSRAPDAVCDLPTPPNMALVYRLTGDENPLHADPERAKAAGFERPILHGAATFGVACHAIMRQIDYRASELASFEARFVRPVFPGETISTEIWRDGGRFQFRCRIAARDQVVLTDGLAVLRS
jgi:acyl dehydratase